MAALKEVQGKRGRSDATAGLPKQSGMAAKMTIAGIKPGLSITLLFV
jgi:hypothetical protein